MVDVTQRVAHGRRRFKRLVGQHFYWKIQSELLFLLHRVKRLESLVVADFIFGL